MTAAFPPPSRLRGSATERILRRTRAEGRAALVGYLPVGYPDVPRSIEAMRALVSAGVDVVEIGVPYSDPGLDGPTIQAAVDPAVRAGVGLRDVWPAVTAVANAGAAALVMTYWNPVERYGVPRFAADLASAGGSGAITPDLIPDEADRWLTASDENDLDRVFLVAPSSTDVRLKKTAAACRGFVYAASTMGVTGARAGVDRAARALVERVRRVAPNALVCVGLGVSTGDQAAEVAGYADGVIVGSALVRCLLDAPDHPSGVARLAELVARLAEGVRR
jgi:tryptophan synthase alpha chain